VVAAAVAAEAAAEEAAGVLPQRRRTLAIE